MEFEKFFSRALEEARREMKIPGFRPGKAPADIALARIDPKHLLEAAADSAVRNTLYSLVAEQKWETVGGPEVNIKKMARGSDFEYEAIFSLFPEIKSGDWKDLKISKKQVEVKDDEAEKVIQDLREQRADFIPAERGIAKGDRVEMDYEMFMDGLRTEEGKQKTEKMAIGQGLFLPEVEENLIGLKKGDEKSFKIVYKSDYAQKRFAGKAVEFRVAVKGVYEAKLPEATDEWAKSFGNFENMGQLREAIKKNLLSEKETKEEERAELEALDLILNTATFGDIPEILVNSEQENMLAELKQSIDHQKLSFEKYLEMIKKTEDDLRKEFAAKAEKRIKTSLIIREIAKQENLKLSDEEIKEELEIAKGEHSGHSHKDEYYESDEFRDRLENILLSRKAVNFIKEQIVKTAN